MHRQVGNNERQGVFNRRLRWCPDKADRPPAELFWNCDFCGLFVLHCCSDENCHHWRVVFTDGACLNNGYAHATSGLGVAMGGTAEDQRRIIVDDSVDTGPRTNQRAELLAAMEGLKMLAEHAEKKKAGKRGQNEWVIATDSEYVVKGMSEWVASWKERGWRKADGKPPTNLDLFQRFDAALFEQERRHGVKMGFWHVPRECNVVADALSKEAARAAQAQANDRSPIVHMTGLAIEL